MPKQPDLATLLAEKLLRQLAVHRANGDYPLTVQRLAELTDSQASAADVLKAVARKPFTERVVLAKKRVLASPVALAQDVAQLASSPLLLEFVLDLVCSVTKPTVAVTNLKTKVEKPLREPFLAALGERIQSNSLTPGIEVLTVGKAKHLHPLKFPLPEPPEIRLANDLVRVLESQKKLGDGAYPLSLERLKELTSPQAPQPLVKKAIKASPFASAVGGLLKKPEALLALKEDREAQVRAPSILESLLRAIRTKDRHAFTPTDLLKLVAADLKPACAEAINEQLETNALRGSVAWIRFGKGKRLLWLWDDVQGSRPAPRGTKSESDFPRRFDDAFDRLNRARGSHNFVSLVDLRRELPLARPTFDLELRQLRMAGRYTLSGAEGRHGLGPEERAAGIMEDGTLLLYVSRRLP